MSARKEIVGRGNGNRGKGRPKGSLNKATADVRVLAQEYGPRVIKVLVDIATSDEQPPAARVSAAKELLDRGYGKSLQAVEHSGGIANLSPVVNLTLSGGSGGGR